MKPGLLIIFICLYLSAFSQDTSYYDTKGMTVKSIRECDSYSVSSKNEADTSRSFYRVYYKSGQPKSESQSINASKLTDGELKEWYSSGQLKYHYFMKNDKINDTVTTYYLNGVVKRKDFYEDGVFKSGHSFGINNKEIAHTNFYQVAEYPGGQASLYKFLGKEMKYPKMPVKK